MLVLTLSFLVAFLDQLSKFVVSRLLEPGQIVPVLPALFQLTYHRNDGAAFGMLGGRNGWLSLFSVLVLITLVAGRRAFFSETRLHRISMGLVSGGIVGNLLDRLRLGGVVDFLDFHWRTHHWPAFNLADSALCVGVGLYVLASFRAGRVQDGGGGSSAESA